MTFHQVAVSGVNSNNYKNGIGRFCMYDAYSRMEILLGQKGVDCLSNARIAVFGLGGFLYSGGTGTLWSRKSYSCGL